MKYTGLMADYDLCGGLRSAGIFGWKYDIHR